jgi:integrase
MANLNELALKVTAVMQDSGYSNVTAWRAYLDAFRPLIHYHNERGYEDYNADVTAEFCEQLTERRLNGEFNRRNASNILSAIKRLNHFYDTGRIDYDFPTKVSKFKLNDYFDEILHDYIVYKDMHPNTRGDVIWIARKFFAWLIKRGHSALETVNAGDIQAFMVHCSGHMASVSVHNAQLYLRKLCGYLYERGLVDNPYTALLSMKVSRESRLYPPTTHDELAAILGQIDRSSKKGKRDYAIIMLGAVLGLRAGDIIRIKLTDINWRRGDITIVQAKTENTVVLPLTADVGSAVRDYILYGRHNTGSNIIFQRHYAPFTPIKDAVSVGEMFDLYRKKAGLPREPFDGKRFHSLRRAFGANMITAGVSVTDVAQTMGDKEIESIKKYVKLDGTHLAECALDFNGIEIGTNAI